MPRRRTHHEEHPAVRFIRRHYPELLFAAALLVGLFLVLEQIPILPTIRHWMEVEASAVSQEVPGAGLLKGLSRSDRVGIALIVVACAALVLRARLWITANPALSAAGCPRCGGSLDRVHRHFFDHILGLYVPVRRYRCHQCHWRGLRVAQDRGGSRGAVARLPSAASLWLVVLFLALAVFVGAQIAVRF